MHFSVLLLFIYHFSIGAYIPNNSIVANEKKLLAFTKQPTDSIRYVIRTSYYNEKTHKSNFRTRIINLKGKILGQWGDNYLCSQSFDCLNYPNARMFLFNVMEQKFLSVDRNGKTLDLSHKYNSIMNVGQGFTALYCVDKTNKFDVYNPQGRFVFNARDIHYYTNFQDDVISVYRNGQWEIRDTGFHLLHAFPPDLQTVDIYPNHGLNTSSDGLIRIDKEKGNFYFVDKHGKLLIDLSKVFGNNIIMQVLPPSERILTVKYFSSTTGKEHWSYVDKNGKIIWTTTSEQQPNVLPFSGGYGKVTYIVSDIKAKQEEARLNGANTMVLESNSKLVNPEGKISYDFKSYFPVIKRNGDLYLTHTILHTMDNRMHGYAVINSKTQKVAFESEWPIVFFDENIVIVGDNDVYENDISDNLIVYDYKKRALWKTPKL